MSRKLHHTKAEVLAACKGCMGICADVQRKLGISRRGFYNYRQKWPEVQEAIDDELQRGLDYAESQLLKLIADKDFRAIAFYLERKGRERGWGQQQQITLQDAMPVQPIICFDGGGNNIVVAGGANDNTAAAATGEQQ